MNNMVETYEGPGNYVFVSYAHDDSHIVYPIIEKLVGMGYRIWYDEGIPLVSDYGSVLYNHIKKCAAFIIFKSFNSCASEDVELEISHALHFRKKIVQIVIDDEAEYPASIAYKIPASRQYMSIAAPRNEFYKKITEQIADCRDPEAIRREQEAAAKQRAGEDAKPSAPGENKAPELKAERKAKGQTALTLRKLRHEKIRRKSRKYKLFRTSVHTLTEYLNSFSVESKR